ncbi:FAD-dependent oxidoreductase [Promicromonospora sp. MEB111]|uniref:FAD-dependent oxidoreductase n=1 Tax=Promicromonospora sp. MEB111 TaxID=3040301 RepID=UPI00254D7988|nr:FAD-dependent oxidoreductase [Promicromonospora sp. MEB111]
MPQVIVVGAGVVGLSAAHELARAGHQVRVVADADTADTVSAVSAALWFPYRSEQSAAADLLLERSLARFEELLPVPEAGVARRPGTVLERTADPDRSWARLFPDAAAVPPDLLPPGVLSGVRVAVPFITVPEYLPWLVRRLESLGVAFERRTVTAVAELTGSADAVVVAAGLRSGELLGDDSSVVPVRGQVVRLANPGLTDWITDDDNPDGLTYVFPRNADVVVGGVAVEGSSDATVHADVAAAMLARATRLVPELAGLPVLGHAAGLRPARPTLRIEAVPGHAVPVVAAYGHGGAGVTLSWGTAERVATLLGDLLRG